MSYNPNYPQYGGGYPGQQYQQTGPYNQRPNVVEYVEVTNYVQPPPPPPAQVVIVENQYPQNNCGGMGTVGTAMAGVALGMALEEALEF